MKLHLVLLISLIGVGSVGISAALTPAEQQAKKNKNDKTCVEHIHKWGCTTPSPSGKSGKVSCPIGTEISSSPPKGTSFKPPPWNRYDFYFHCKEQIWDVACTAGPGKGGHWNNPNWKYSKVKCYAGAPGGP